MISNKSTFIVVFLCALAACSGDDPEQVSNKPPNVLLIIADDMGTAELGAFGSEIETPNLDKLAYAGIRFSNFRASSVCSPSRAMMFTGVDNHKAGLGNMHEELAPNQKGQPGIRVILITAWSQWRHCYAMSVTVLTTQVNGIWD